MYSCYNSSNKILIHLFTLELGTKTSCIKVWIVYHISKVTMELALLKIEVKELINAANRAANIKPLTPVNERDVTLIVRLNSRTHILAMF